MAEGGNQPGGTKCFHCEATNPVDEENPSLICDFCHAFLYADLTALDGDSGDSGNEDADSISGDSISNQPVDEVVSDVDVVARAEVVEVQANLVSRDQLAKLSESVPPEVLLVIFSYLDDLSKWACSKVCKRWSTVVSNMHSDNDWRAFVARRWPLFNPQYKVVSYRELYSRIVESSFCFRCLGVDLFTSPSLSLRRLHQRRAQPFIRPLWAEVRCLRNDAPDGIAALPLVDNRTVWTASIAGPVGSPYEGGLFFLSIRIPVNYPIFAPRVIFLTRIYHPNVSLHGDIGVDLFSRSKWSVAVSLSKLLISIQSLLTDPYPEIAMHPDAAQLYMTDVTSFNKTAREWTWTYAMLDYLPGPPPISIKRPLNCLVDGQQQQQERELRQNYQMNVDNNVVDNNHHLIDPQFLPDDASLD